MNETKHVIGILCQHLNFVLTANVRPEHFRLAKFNKTNENIVEIFWNILGKFVKDPVALSTVDAVKLFLYRLNYESLYFYCLPEDMSYGSRELLLALGFVITKGLLDDVVRENMARIPFSSDFRMLTHSGFKGIYFDNKQLRRDNDKMNAVVWMKGKIKLNRRMTRELEEQSEKMLKKMNDSVSIANVPKLSINEIIALKNKDYGREFLRRTDDSLTLVENHEKWIKKQRVFWLWMNSVLAERNKNENKLELEFLNSFSLLVKNNTRC